MEKVLEVVDLRVYYEIPQGTVKAVDGVDLDVFKGEILGLLVRVVLVSQHLP